MANYNKMAANIMNSENSLIIMDMQYVTIIIVSTRDDNCSYTSPCTCALGPVDLRLSKRLKERNQSIRNNIRYRSSVTSRVLASKHLFALEYSLIKGAWHTFRLQVFTLLIKGAWHAFRSCTPPLLLAIILARANVYSRALAILT